MKGYVQTSSFLFLVLLYIKQVQGQTCIMVNQADKKISDAKAASLQVLSGPTDFDTCVAECLTVSTCAIVEYRTSLCIALDDNTALVDNAGSTSAIKVCTSDFTTLPTDFTTEDSAPPARPVSTAILVASVLVSLLSRRQ